MVAIETDTMFVRPICVADAEAFADLVGRSRMSVEVHREKLARIDQLTVQRKLVFIGIFRKTDGVLMGFCGVSRSQDTDSGDVDYWMGEPFRNFGYLSEAAPAVIQLAERLLEISAFEAVVNAENVASAAVARRMGMTLLASVERTVDGKSWTELRFGRGGHDSSGSVDGRES